mgnify:CR=1 FL=1
MVSGLLPSVLLSEESSQKSPHIQVYTSSENAFIFSFSCYVFQASQPDELTIEEHEVLEVIEDGDMEDWVKVSLFLRLFSLLLFRNWAVGQKLGVVKGRAELLWCP